MADKNDPVSCAFWTEPEEKRHDAIWENVTRIDRANEGERMNDLFHASLYGNVQRFGFSPKSSGRAMPRAHARLSLNVVRNMVSAVVSKIAAKNKVHPKFLTNGGNPSLQRRAKKLEKAVTGIFYDQKFYRTQRLIFRDIGIFGSGFIRPWVDEVARTVTLERVPKWDILVDSEESTYGDPRTLYHRKYFDRRVLAKMFPEKSKIIKSAGKRGEETETQTNTDTTSDVIPVIEAFHRPSVVGADDGMRVVCVDSGVLGSDDWNYDYHPFPKLDWTKEPEGFFGTGLAYELAGIQCEINDVLQEFARAHRLLKGFWAVEKGSKVVLKHINDDLGKIITYAGVLPQYYQPVAIPQDTYRYLWDLYAKAFEIAGISQLSASGQKPAGLNSGEAQRVYDDIQTERFLEVGTDLEDWTMDVTEQCLDRARELAADTKGGGYKVAAVTDRGFEDIAFTADDLKKDDYRIQIFPTSMLPNTPAGRLAMVGDMMQAKIVEDPAQAFKLLGYPDLEAFSAQENAPAELLDANMEKILEEGKWVSPEPLDDHDLALEKVPRAIAHARNRGVEPERLSLARRYLVLTVRLKNLQMSGKLDTSVISADPDADPNGPPPGGPPPMPPPPGAGPPMPPMPPPPMPIPEAA